MIVGGVFGRAPSIPDLNRPDSSSSLAATATADLFKSPEGAPQGPASPYGGGGNETAAAAAAAAVGMFRSGSLQVR